MSEAISATRPHFSWSRALIAGLAATVVMTVFMMLLGTNIMKTMGSMLVPGGSTTLQYIVGGASHLLVGLFYGVVYAWLVGRVTEWNRFVKGAMFGLAITAIALAVMPLMAMATDSGDGGTNPCAVGNPCAGKNPCNPCAAKSGTNPCNPCAGSQGPYSGAISTLNHLVYALTLAYAYGHGARP